MEKAMISFEECDEKTYGNCPIHKKTRLQKLKYSEDAPSIRWCPECKKKQEVELEKQRESKHESLWRQRVKLRLETARISPRFKDKSFDNWRAVTPHQKQVKEKLLKLHKTLQTDTPTTGAILCGKPGTGKNHLSVSFIRKAIIEQNKTALMTTAFKIVSDIKTSWRAGSKMGEKEIINSYTTVDILVIDEVGVQFGSDSEIMYLTHIINERYEHFRPTLILSNLPLVGDDSNNSRSITSILGERVVDRFREGGSVLVFDWESHRGKENLL